MSEILQHADSTELKILIVFDINQDNSQKLCTKILQRNELYECIIVCDDSLGGIGIIIIFLYLYHPLIFINTENILSQFKSICNKVIYLHEKLPHDGEDADAASNGLMNVNGRKCLLNEMLYVAGYDEFRTELKDMNNVLDDIIDNDMLEDQQVIRDNFDINTAEKTTEMISKLLLTPERKSGDEFIQTSSGIFIFRYKYTHSLNKFLFYPETINTGSINLLIVPSTSEESSRLPSTYCNFSIVVPKSFNTTGSYYTACMSCAQSSSSWSVSKMIL